MTDSKQAKKQSPKNSFKPEENSNDADKPKIRHKTVEKSLIYKHCAPFTGKVNLQKLVNKFRELTIKEKKLQSGNDKESFYFINRITDLSGYCCGEVCLYTHDKHQEILEMDEEDYTCDISAISPEDVASNNKEDQSEVSHIKKQFAKSILYFMIKDNHIILAQSASIKSGNLELYINTVLKNHELIDKSQYLYFKDQLNPETIKNVNNAEYVKLSSPFKTEVTTNKIGEKETFIHTLTGKCWKAFNELFTALGLSLNSSITLTEKLKENVIKGEIILKFPGKKSYDDTPLIGELATAIRNIDNDELDYEIGLGNNNKLTKKEIKLSKNVKVKATNGLVDSRDFYLKMIEYFNELKEIRRILPK